MRACVLFALCAAVLRVGAAPAAAGDNTLSDAERRTGWLLLFDGKTMNGWDDPSRKTPAGQAWVIEDGCLKAVKSPRLREDLLTTREFGDFELVFDWRISPGGNSGVKYRIQDRVLLQRSLLKPGHKRFEETVDYEYERRLARRDALTESDRIEDYPIAFEYQVIDNAAHPDALRGARQSAGALYSLVAPSAQTARPAGEWNNSRIVLRGNHVQHWLNGVQVIDTDLNTPEIEQSLAGRWGKQSPVYRLLMEQPRRRCPVGLQNHNDEAWFRNIKIRPL